MEAERDRAEAAVDAILEGRCPCPKCPGGRLSDPLRSPRSWRHCEICGCAWQTVKYGTHRYPLLIFGEHCTHWGNVMPAAVHERRKARSPYKKRYH